MCFFSISSGVNVAIRSDAQQRSPSLQRRSQRRRRSRRRRRPRRVAAEGGQGFVVVGAESTHGPPEPAGVQLGQKAGLQPEQGMRLWLPGAFRHPCVDVIVVTS